VEMTLITLSPLQGLFFLFLSLFSLRNARSLLLLFILFILTNRSPAQPLFRDAFAPIHRLKLSFLSRRRRRRAIRLVCDEQPRPPETKGTARYGQKPVVLTPPARHVCVCCATGDESYRASPASSFAMETAFGLLLFSPAVLDPAYLWWRWPGCRERERGVGGG